MVDPKHAEMMDRIHTEAERDRLAAENAELRRRLDKICEYAKHNKRNRRFITIAEGRTG